MINPPILEIVIFVMCLTTRTLFAAVFCGAALCAFARPADAACAAANKYVAAAEAAEGRYVSDRPFVTGDALTALTDDANSALNQAKKEPCNSKAEAGSIEALEAWYLMESNANLWSLAKPTTSTNQPNPPECVAYYTAASKVVRANTWYLLWQAYRTPYRGDIWWKADHSMDETNAHIPLALPPFSASAAVASDFQHKYAGDLVLARRTAASMIDGSDCYRR